mgnify:CR=1 FL=1
MLIAAKAHCYGFLLRRFVEAIERADPELRLVLTKLCVLYSLHTLQETVGTYALQSGYYSPAQFSLVRSQVHLFIDLFFQKL